MTPVDRLEQIKGQLSSTREDDLPIYCAVNGDDVDWLISEIESLRAQVERCVAALELALSFCPKGPVYDGMDPTFYHTLCSKDECKLQERIDSARGLLATLQASGEGK